MLRKLMVSVLVSGSSNLFTLRGRQKQSHPRGPNILCSATGDGGGGDGGGGDGGFCGGGGIWHSTN